MTTPDAITELSDLRRRYARGIPKKHGETDDLKLSFVNGRTAFLTGFLTAQGIDPENRMDKEQRTAWLNELRDAAQPFTEEDAERGEALCNDLALLSSQASYGKPRDPEGYEALTHSLLAAEREIRRLLSTLKQRTEALERIAPELSMEGQIARAALPTEGGE